MLILKSNIKITQQSSDQWPSRSNSFEFDFMRDCEVVSTWQNLSDTASVTVPQKVKFVAKDGSSFNWLGKNIGGGGDDTAPLILRGDKIEIYLGYDYFDGSKSKRVVEINNVFSGWVSEVESKTPMTIKGVDNMWKLTQIQAPNRTWKNMSLQAIIKELIKGTDFKLQDTIAGKEVKTDIGDLITQNQTVAQVLEFIRKNYQIESFFKGDTLYSASFRYWEEDVKEHVFRFQENIIESDLKYQRTDDVILGVEGHSYEKFSTGTRKDGKARKSFKRLSVFANYERGKLTFYDEKPDGWEGEIRTLNLAAANLETLKTAVEKNIYRLIFVGFKGSFETFGLPFVRHGDDVALRNELLPDQNGIYKVKANTMTFGQGGYRQKIDIDMRIDSFTDAQKSTGL